MYKVTIAFYKVNQPSADWQDKLIGWWTNGPYSHVEIIVDGKMYSSSPRDGKIRERDAILDDHERWDYVTVYVSNKKNFYKFFEQVNGNKYDWAGILGFIIPFRDSENKYFCSEFVTRALQFMGYSNLYSIKAGITSPNRLYKLLSKDK